MYISKNLLYLRKINNLSRYRLSKDLNVNESVIRSIEKDISKNPRVKLILELAKYFNVSIDDLISKDLSNIK